jgi:hypothetical protein
LSDLSQLNDNMNSMWKGVIISESLEEPSLLNEFDGTRPESRNETNSSMTMGPGVDGISTGYTQQKNRSNLCRTRSRKDGMHTFGTDRS